MLSLRYGFRLTKAFIARFKVTLILGIVVGIIIFLAFNWMAPFLPGTTTQRIGVPGRFSIETIPQNILSQVGNGLTRIDEKGNVLPDLASSWETPDKGKTWIFKLDEKRTWQDGKKITSSDISYKFSDAKVEKPDSGTLIFKLQNSFAPFPSIVSLPVFRKGLLGTGDWKVTKTTLTGTYIQQLVMVDKNKNSKIYKFYPTEERTKLAFRLGQVDKIINIFNPQPFAQWKTAKITESEDLNSYVAIFLNTQDSLFGDSAVRFRQALAYSIDKSQITGKRVISPISPNSWAYNSQTKPYNYDLEKARQLFKDYQKESKIPANFKLTTISSLLPIAEKVNKDWEKIGVKTSVQVVSAVPEEYQALLVIFKIPNDPDQYSVWHSTQSVSNLSRYKNVRIDKLLEDGRTELNSEQRRKIYLDFQRFLAEDSPVIFLNHPVFYTISRK